MDKKQMDSINRYKKEHVKRYVLEVNKGIEKDLYDFLESYGTGKATLIKKLLRDEMQKQK